MYIVKLISWFASAERNWTEVLGPAGQEAYIVRQSGSSSLKVGIYLLFSARSVL